MRSTEGPALVTCHSLSEERSPLRILLAEDEDNVMNQKLASHLLEKGDHDVIKVGNGREALERLENESIDLVLIDVQMPEIGGFAATAKIRKMEEATGNHPPVNAMTTHAMQGD